VADQTTDNKKREYIFGPVPSRRLGRSLGVDVVPFKTCTYDCIYCQLGRTTNKTAKREAWIPTEIIIDQLKNKLHTKPDYITISGSGEPTLYSKIGEAICKIKEITGIPIAVLTNGSLLWLPEVRHSLRIADLVLPSLDAGSEQLFRYVNRPHRDISFSRMLEGLVRFRDEYTGRFWLEVLLLSGVTTVEAQINMLAHCIKLICPDKVQINTVTRPAVQDFAIAVPANKLKVIARQLSEKVEIIADNHVVNEQCDTSVDLQDVLALLRRRPCSVDDIALGLGLHRNAVLKCIEQLCSQQKAKGRYTAQGLFYKALI
jgi:wyosine [tRNA(Phe)-imidazoG37] synthetase (radical SAM superfamily)